MTRRPIVHLIVHRQWIACSNREWLFFFKVRRRILASGRGGRSPATAISRALEDYPDFARESNRIHVDVRPDATGETP